MPDPGSSIKEMVEQLKQEHSTNECLRLSFEQCQVALWTNSVHLKEILTDYFRGFVTTEKSESGEISVVAIEGLEPVFDTEFTIKQPDPGKTKIKEEYIDFPDGRVVRKRLTGMVFYFGSGDNLAIGPCLENPNQVINFINNRYIEWLLRKDFLLAHAAGVIWKNKGIAMAGFSGMGKSTLALHFMSKGSDFVSNDRLLFKQEGSEYIMKGIPKLPRINPGTALNNPDLKKIVAPEDKTRFEKMDLQELWEHEEKYDVFIDQCFGDNKFKLSHSLDLIVLLNWKHNSEPTQLNEISLESRRDLLPAFMKSPGLFYEPEENALIEDCSEETYIDHLQGFPVVEISGRVDFERAIDLISDYLDPDKNSLERRTVMAKKNISLKGEMDTKRAISYLEDIIKGLKEGTICIQQGTDLVTLKPSSTVDMELEASLKEDKEKISLKLAWKQPTEIEEPDKDFKISFEEPVSTIAEGEEEPVPAE